MRLPRTRALRWRTALGAPIVGPLALAVLTVCGVRVGLALAPAYGSATCGA